MSDLTLEMACVEKTFNMKVVRLVETVNIAFGLIPSEVVCHHKKDPHSTANLNRTVLESSDKTSPNLTRVLDVN